MKVTPTSGLTQDEVDSLVHEGDKYKEMDELRRQLADLKNQSETLLYTTQAALEGYADLVDAEVLESAKAQAAHLRELLSGGELETIRQAHQTLEATVFSIAENMYGTQDAPDEPPP